MNTNEFKRLLRIFADQPDDVDLGRDEVAIQVQNQLITFKAYNRDGQVWVEESGVSSTAESWIAGRLANLPMLAQRIIQFTEQPKHFIAPNGFYVDRIESSPTDADVYVDNALSHLESLIENGSGLSSFAVYLTAEAGEGKSTLINHLAIRQAQRYIARTSQRLVVPIQLGGRSFLRLDDMIIGSIANHYKFRGLYMDTFLELVKFGFIVPAFDGFEEMFVVGSSGEAVSSLGNLLANLSSMGQLLISARTAYFEIRDFETQARLFDGLRTGEASFSRLKIQRWNRTQFVEYWELRGLPGGAELFDILSEKLGSEEHSLLTRAVLVKRMADIAEDPTRFDRLIQRIGVAAASYFSELIDSILEREIEEKWLDRAEEGVNRPLLNLSQHHLLLSMISVEMAVTASSQLTREEINLVTELFCGEQQLAPQLSRQVLSRIYDHPLLSKSDSNTNLMCFDHEEFRDFFFGKAIADFVVSENMADFQSVIQKSVISASAVDSFIGSLEKGGRCFSNASDFIQAAISSENPASYAKENGSRLIMKAIQQPGLKGVTVKDAFMSPDSFVDAHLSDLVFESCYSHNALLRGCQLINCTFRNCEFDSIELSETSVIHGTTLSDCVIHCVSLGSEDGPNYNPESIDRILSHAGFSIVDSSSTAFADTAEPVDDDYVALMGRALRSFQRSTGINEATLRQRLGKRANDFEDHILPKLLESGILVLGTYRGAGVDRRFKLGVPMAALESALREAKGSLPTFLGQFTDDVKSIS